jgi:hypothetical protein
VCASQWLAFLCLAAHSSVVFKLHFFGMAFITGIDLKIPCVIEFKTIYIANFELVVLRQPLSELHLSTTKARMKGWKAPIACFHLPEACTCIHKNTARASSNDSYARIHTCTRYQIQGNPGSCTSAGLVHSVTALADSPLTPGQTRL